FLSLCPDELRPRHGSGCRLHRCGGAQGARRADAARTRAIVWRLCGPRGHRVAMSLQPLNRLQIAWRAAQDITGGMLVNLGIGMPVPGCACLPPDADFFIQSENGVMGVGALASPDRADTDLVDAGS